MRLVIDCFKLVKGAGKSVGIYNVALNLVRNLLKTKPSDNELVVLGNRYNCQDFEVEGAEFHEISGYDPLKRTDYVIWELFGVNKYIREYRADVVLFPRGFRPLFCNVRDVVLIHDMIPFYYNEYYPQVFGKLENAYIMNRLRASARGAGRVITISENAKSDIIKYAGVSERRIIVINNSCEDVFIPDRESSKSYICAITTSLPHKNARGIVEAYRRYWDMSKEPLDLVIIGIEDASVYGLPESLSKHVKCHRFIKDSKALHSMIYDARVFLFLSYKEGFGLPPLEAMQLGVPVICSDRSSLPEVVGDAAILVDPDQYEDIAFQIDRLVNDGSLCDEQINRGHENCRRFEPLELARHYWEGVRF